MKRLLHSIICLGLLVSLSSCGGQVSPQSGGGDTIAFRYARGLTVVEHDDYTYVELKNPWKADAVLHRYVLVPRNASLPDGLPDGTVVRTPLSRSIVFTTVHCAMLQMLGKEASIAGIADLKYIKLPYVHQQIAKGRIADVGDGLSPVVEKIIDIRPDALLLSPFENSGGYGRLEAIDIPIIECAEYMEATPLGRAEWLRFYGLLFGCRKQADSLFAVVDSSYNSLKALAGSGAAAGKGKKVLVDKITGSVWYVPGGRSTIGQMLSDAGADYPWADDSHNGSVALPFEVVLERAGQSDIWLFRYSGKHDITLRELLTEHHGYGQLQPVRTGACYGCNVETSLFYEESPFRPDYLLTDFLNIIHPEIEGIPPLRYYHRVE